ncbi:MAG: TonB family protein [Bacteroidales bacterium]
MKRNEKKVPGFDEIIFRNRNKEYGAYDLRRRYKSAASLSILGVSAFFSALIILISGFMPKEATAKPDPVIDILVISQNLKNPDELVQPEIKKPVIQPEQIKYVPPVISDDSALSANTLMANDVAASLITNGNVPENIDSAMKDIAPDPVRQDDIIITCEELPMFPGGPEALLKYIADNTKYPDEAVELNLQGKVIVKFAVLYDGSVSRIEILRSVCPLLDQEAARVVSTLPKWKPGKQNGTPVSVWFTVPVSFQLK